MCSFTMQRLHLISVHSAYFSSQRRESLTPDTTKIWETLMLGKLKPSTNIEPVWVAVAHIYYSISAVFTAATAFLFPAETPASVLTFWHCDPDLFLRHGDKTVLWNNHLTRYQLNPELLDQGWHHNQGFQDRKLVSRTLPLPSKTERFKGIVWPGLHILLAKTFWIKPGTA